MNYRLGFARWSISEYVGIRYNVLATINSRENQSKKNIIGTWEVQLIPQCSNHSPVADATNWSAQQKSDVKESKTKRKDLIFVEPWFPGWAANHCSQLGKNRHKKTSRAYYCDFSFKSANFYICHKLKQLFNI